MDGWNAYNYQQQDQTPCSFTLFLNSLLYFGKLLMIIDMELYWLCYCPDDHIVIFPMLVHLILN